VNRGGRRRRPLPRPRSEAVCRPRGRSLRAMTHGPVPGFDEVGSRLFLFRKTPSFAGAVVLPASALDLWPGQVSRQQRRLSGPPSRRLVPVDHGPGSGMGLWARPQASRNDRHGIRWVTEAAMLRALQTPCPGVPVLVFWSMAFLPLDPGLAGRVLLFFCVHGDLARCLAIGLCSHVVLAFKTGVVMGWSRRLASRFPGSGLESSMVGLWHGECYPEAARCRELRASSTPRRVLSLTGAHSLAPG